MYQWKNDLSYMNIPVTKLDTRRPGAQVRGKEPFVKFPLAWRTRLEKAHHVATMWLALFILYKSWKHPGEPIVVSNIAVKDWGGLSREAKRIGLRELEALGLVSIEQVGRRSPLVKILDCQSKPHSPVSE
jgi:hypothetical protein